MLARVGNSKKRSFLENYKHFEILPSLRHLRFIPTFSSFGGRKESKLTSIWELDYEEAKNSRGQNSVIKKKNARNFILTNNLLQLFWPAYSHTFLVISGWDGMFSSIYFFRHLLWKDFLEKSILIFSPGSISKCRVQCENCVWCRQHLHLHIRGWHRPRIHSSSLLPAVLLVGRFLLWGPATFLNNK